MTLTLDRQFDQFYFSRNADLATYIRKIDCFPDSRFDPNFFCGLLTSKGVKKTVCSEWLFASLGFKSFKNREISMQLILYPYALRQIQSKYSDTIYRFEDLKTRKRMEKTAAQNIDFEESCDRFKFLPETRGSKMVFKLQLPNQSPERNDSSEEN